ncbi:serine carboxypeptidase-domain-containing protein [Baffinella frigidus]|nr:serine carboxypeptidase-domain-containing protein [Cryptophyta sp. CCMP2293]
MWIASGAPSDYDHDEEGVSRDMLNFLHNFFAAHPEKLANPFFLFGESYGGHFVPATAYKLFQANEAKTAPVINLKGVGVGNGLTVPQGVGVGNGLTVPQGVGVGNGLTVPQIQYDYYSAYTKTNPIHPLIQYDYYSTYAKTNPIHPLVSETVYETNPIHPLVSETVYEVPS